MARRHRSLSPFAVLARVGSIASLLVVVGPAVGVARAAEDVGREIPDVPSTLPAAYAVMAFENRSGVAGLGWISAGAAFMVAEKAEAIGDLMPTYGPLVVPPGPPQPVAEASVAAFAKAADARYVWTGWVARPDWELELGVALW